MIYFIGVKRTENKIKKILVDSAKHPKTNPLVAKAFLDIMLKIFGEYDEDLIIPTTDKLFKQLMRDGEVYFKTDDFETSLKRLEEAYAVSRTQPQMDEALKYKERAEAMVKFDQAKWKFAFADVDPLKIMVLLEEAKTISNDYEIPGYAELKAKILKKINETHGKSSG
jgi:hypothetical protein